MKARDSTCRVVEGESSMDGGDVMPCGLAGQRRGTTEFEGLGSADRASI